MLAASTAFSSEEKQRPAASKPSSFSGLTLDQPPGSEIVCDPGLFPVEKYGYLFITVILYYHIIEVSQNFLAY